MKVYTSYDINGRALHPFFTSWGGGGKFGAISVGWGGAELIQLLRGRSHQAKNGQNLLEGLSAIICYRHHQFESEV